MKEGKKRAMTMVVAIIRPDCLDEVKATLDDLGILGISVCEIRGSGRQRGYVHRYRQAEYHVNLLEKLRVEVVVADADVEAVVEAIREGAHTGEVGDGKIFLLPVADAVRIRTGERGDAAVQ
jgi:nitrogen regulatory protein P-II 1